MTASDLEAPTIEINGRMIGAGQPMYIVAEMSGNHNQDFDRAVRQIEVAKEAGADAVKLQTYTPDTLTIDSDKPHFRIEGTSWDGRNLYDLYGEAHTPWAWHPRLKAVADGIGLTLFSTPFDDTAVDFLEEVGVSAYKVASFEIVDLPLIRRVARTGKPTIISTGMSTLAEIAEAVDAFRQAGGGQFALLKTTSAYPAEPDDMHLRTIPHLGSAFGVPSGLSDHTLSLTVPVAAAAVGGSILEKHYTLARADGGPDSEFSLEPHELKTMIVGIREAERALGRIHYGPADQERDSIVFRRSLFIVEDVRAGEQFTSRNVRSIRPGYGLHTRHLDEVLGRSARVDVERGTPLEWSHVG
jgi:N-acetylneuraminate synthase